MIDDFEYYRNKLRKPDRYHPQLFSNSAFEGNTRQTFAAVTVIKDGVLTVEWKVEGL